MFKANCRNLLNIRIFILKFLGKLEVCKLLASPFFLYHIYQIYLFCVGVVFRTSLSRSLFNESVGKSFWLLFQVLCAY